MPEDLPQDRPLDREWLARTVATALDEDLGGRPGRDVTTQATISRDAVVSGDVVVREDGVIAGLAVIAEVLAQVADRLGLATPTRHDARDRWRPRDGGDGRGQHRGGGARRPHRGTHDSQPHVEGVGRRHAHATLGGRARGHGRSGSRHAKDDARSARTRQVRGAVRRRDEQALRPLRLRDDQGQPHRRGRIGGRRDRRDSCARSPTCRFRSRSRAATQAIEALDAGVRFLMLDNMSPAAMATLIAELRARRRGIRRRAVRGDGRADARDGRGGGRIGS